MAFDWEKGTKMGIGGAGAGAAAGSAAGPWGTAAGAGIGFLGGLLGGGYSGSDGPKDAPPPYNPNPSAFKAPTMGSHPNAPGRANPNPQGPWGPDQWYLKMGQKYSDPSQDYVNKARGYGQQIRGDQQSALGMLARRAQGEESIARQAAQAALERNQQAIASQVRSARGGYNPALERSGIQAVRGAGADIAAQASMAESMERQKAQDAYLSALAGVRGQDQGQQGMEQDFWSKQAQWEAMKNQLARQWAGLGLQDKEAERNARIRLEELKAGIAGQGQQIALQDRMLAQQQGMADDQFANNWMLGGMSAGSSALSALAKGSQNKAPASGGISTSGTDNDLIDPWA